MDFKKLAISENIVNVLNKKGIKTPTPVQIESIPIITRGSDLISQAQTGTGKTLAFLLPIFEKIDTSKNEIQSLIITPTRELAIQITQEAEKLQEGKNIGILSAYGGKDISSQIKKLKKDIHLVIATPGRLIDHLMRKSIDLSKVNTIVLDEADEMLFMGFKNDIESIMKFMPKKRQILCFSATMDSAVKKLAYRYMKDPSVVSIKSTEVTLENITQEVVETTDRNKQDDLCKVLEEDNAFMAIIFCRTKARVDKLDENLHQRGFNCVKIHSDIQQSKRERIMKSFRNAEIQYLIATDVAARGIDVTGVTHVYNYDIPETVESYIHRIGRCGRSGENGYTCLFVDPKNEKMLTEIENNIKLTIKRRTI
ncbi:DEAD/DEAH box helicase [Romboutsia lituseburensis]|nr:DEAD/DEAH box helicase [Romboutsia lituseburensis]MCR8744887.1 DEAD/DEAH box helicase [Romboutsia lituseburensis]